MIPTSWHETHAPCPVLLLVLPGRCEKSGGRRRGPWLVRPPHGEHQLRGHQGRCRRHRVGPVVSGQRGGALWGPEVGRDARGSLHSSHALFVPVLGRLMSLPPPPSLSISPLPFPLPLPLSLLLPPTLVCLDRFLGSFFIYFLPQPLMFSVRLSVVRNSRVWRLRAREACVDFPALSLSLPAGLFSLSCSATHLA